MRSWEAWCFLWILILVLISNQLAVFVKIDVKQQQEETSALSIGTRRTSAGLQVQYLQGKLAKLGGVVPYVYIHPRTSIQ